MKNLLKVFGVGGMDAAEKKQWSLSSKLRGLKSTWMLILILMVGFSFAGCGDGGDIGNVNGKTPGNQDTDPAALTGVTLPATVYVPVGGTTTLTPSFEPLNAANKNVTWASANSSKASVNAEGVVTGISLGETTITVTTEEGGFTATSTVMIVNVPSSISVSNLPAKQEYRIGEPLNTAGLIVTAHADPVNFEIPVNDLKFSGMPATSAGTKQVTVSYTVNEITRTTTFNVTVTSVSLTDIELSGYKTQYYAGDNFEPSGLMVKAMFSEGEDENIPLSNVSITGFDSDTAGNKTITVTYGTKSKTYNVTVSAVELSSIEITHYPNNVVYNVGSPLDTNGLAVKAIYNNGSTSALTIAMLAITGYNSGTTGNQVITVTYQGKQDTFEVLVIGGGLTVTNFVLTAPPDKTIYYQGEELVLNGMIATATFSNGQSWAIPHGAFEPLRGFNSSKDAVIGTQNIEVEFNGHVIEFNITMTKVTINGDMTITMQPDKTVYHLGETLDLSGLRVRLRYNSSGSAYIYYEAGDANLSASSLNSSSSGKKIITVTFKNPFDASDTRTATFVVEVNPWIVSFNSNGGNTEADPDTKPVTTLGGNVGALPTAPAKTGWIFTSWNTQANGSGTVFTASTAVTGNITVYAQWRKIKVTFNPNGGNWNGSTANRVEETDTGFAPNNLTPPVNANVPQGLYKDTVPAALTLGGWRKEGENVDWNFETVITEDIILVAQWSGLSINLDSVTGANIAVKAVTYINNASNPAGDYILLLTDATTNLAPQTLSRSGTKLTLRGHLTQKEIQLSSNDSLFRINFGVTLVLDNYITLRGRASNNGSVVRIFSGGNFEMNDGAVITGNTTSAYGSGVSVSGTFTMNGGTISGNTTTNSGYGGGGVLVDGTFNMLGGIIKGNTASGGPGGGVSVDMGTMRISGGKILGSNATVVADRNTATTANSAAVYQSSGTKILRGTFNEAGVFTQLGTIANTANGFTVTNGAAPVTVTQ